jgi:virulence-associated protein VapD
MIAQPPHEAYLAINFDIDTIELKKLIASGQTGFSSVPTAYNRIKAFLKKQHFGHHRQWSGYRSIEPVSFREAAMTVQDLAQANPWLKDCMRVADITEVTAATDLLPAIQAGATRPNQPIAAPPPQHP